MMPLAAGRGRGRLEQHSNRCADRSGSVELPWRCSDFPSSGTPISGPNQVPSKRFGIGCTLAISQSTAATTPTTTDASCMTRVNITSTIRAGCAAVRPFSESSKVRGRDW